MKENMGGAIPRRAEEAHSPTRVSSGASESACKHSFSCKEREEIELLGVTDVQSFDSRGVDLSTTMGELMIEGEDLRVCELDLERGRVCVSGRLCALYYPDAAAEKKRGLRSKRG